MRSSSESYLKAYQPMSLFFDNNSYNIEEELEDDDPFYEIYDCHKTTYIEKKL